MASNTHVDSRVQERRIRIIYGKSTYNSNKESNESRSLLNLKFSCVKVFWIYLSVLQIYLFKNYLLEP